MVAPRSQKPHTFLHRTTRTIHNGINSSSIYTRHYSQVLNISIHLGVFNAQSIGKPGKADALTRASLDKGLDIPIISETWLRYRAIDQQPEPANQLI